MCANFWWGSSEKGKKMHWKAWSHLQKVKDEGGLGFRNLSHLNKALLAKQVWRIMANPNSLVARILKARYFKHTDIMEATLGSNPSYIWRSLLWSKDIIRKGILWKIGSGGSINVLSDVWIPGLGAGKITSTIPRDANISINSLLDNLRSWNMDKLQSLFLPYEVEAIRRVPVASPNDKDTRFWRFEKKGSYPVKTGYWTSFKTNEYTSRANSEASSSQKDPFWKTLWGLNIPKKVKIFI